MKKTLLFSCLLCISSFAFSQFKINSFLQPDTIRFDTFTGTGLTPTPVAGQLNSSYWRFEGFSDGNTQFGGQYTSGDYSRGQSNGNVTVGGIYSFDNGQTGNILGVQPTGNDFNPGRMTLKIQNNTSQIIKDIVIKYDFWFLNNEDRASSFNFYFSSNDTTYYADTTAIATTVEASDTMGWDSYQKIVTLSNINIAVGDLLYVQWRSEDVSGTGSRDEFGINDIVISATAFSGFPTAGVQFINNSADSALSSVDIYMGDSLIINNLAFRNATRFLLIDADDTLEMSVAPGNSIDTSSAYWKGDVFFGDGNNYVAIVNGLVSAGYNPSAATHPLDLFIHRGRKNSLNVGNTDILFFNGSTDIGALDVVETSVPSGTVIDNLNYGEFNGYGEYFTANYVVDVKDSTSSTTLYSFPLDLLNRNLIDSAIVTLTSGFHNPSANNNGPALDIMYAPAQGGSLISFRTLVGINEQNAESKLNIYPNPVVDYLTVQSSSDNAELRIYTVDGREVYHKILMKDREVINVSTLPQGILLLKVSTEEGTSSKIIVRN